MVNLLIVLGLIFVIMLIEQIFILLSLKLTPTQRFLIIAVIFAPISEEIGRLVSLHFDTALTYTLIIAVGEFVAGTIQILISPIWRELEDKVMLIGLRVAVIGMHILCYYLLTLYGAIPAILVHMLWNGVISQTIVYYGVSNGRQIAFRVYKDPLELLDSLNC